MTKATVAFPLRTASRACSRLEGFTSRYLSAVKPLAISLEIELPSWSTASTGMRLVSVVPALPPKMYPKKDAMAMGAATLINSERRLPKKSLMSLRVRARNAVSISRANSFLSG